MNSIIFILVCTLLCASCKFRPQSAQLTDASQDPFASKEAYQKYCADAGVALPNQPLANNDFWQSKRVASTDYPHFGGLGASANLYMHEKDGSGCILGLAGFGGVAELDGTASAICWSDKGDVCFWEDPGVPEKIRENDNVYLITNRQNSHPNAKFVSPPCTTCHNGDNPFVSHDGRGDPAYDNFPEVKFNRALVPNDWPPLRIGKPQIQCAGTCHSIPEPTIDYCAMAVGMISKGLMIGTEIGLLELVYGPLKDKTLPPGSLVDEDVCQKYKAFLETCDGLQTSSEFTYDFNRNLKNLGRCL